MKTFTDYVALQEATFGQPEMPQQEPTWEQLRDFWNRYGKSYVRFKDWFGKIQIGKLVGLHDEGVFLVKTRDGQTHDVYMDNILGVQGTDHTPSNRYEPGPQQVSGDRRMARRM